MEGFYIDFFSVATEDLVSQGIKLATPGWEPYMMPTLLITECALMEKMASIIEPMTYFLTLTGLDLSGLK